MFRIAPSIANRLTQIFDARGSLCKSNILHKITHIKTQAFRNFYESVNRRRFLTTFYFADIIMMKFRAFCQ